MLRTRIMHAQSTKRLVVESYTPADSTRLDAPLAPYRYTDAIELSE
jgi:hypothetical protein